MKQPGYRNPYQVTVAQARAREIQKATEEAVQTGRPIDLSEYKKCPVMAGHEDASQALGNKRETVHKHAEKPFLGVYYVNCRVYGRMYRNDAGTAYVGHCPRCGKQARARIGTRGYSDRFFKAYCRG